MGVDSFFHPKIGGGWLFLPTLYISSQLSFASAPWLPQPSQGQKSIESGQKVAKVNIYLLGFVSPREFRRQETAKFKIYLNFEGAGASVVALSLGRWWCPLGAGGALLLPLFGRVPSLSPCLCPLSRFPFLLCLSKMPLFSVFRGFLARFGVWMYVCMCLGFLR